jgi:DNA-binding IclR family transcriptional regulator
MLFCVAEFLAPVGAPCRGVQRFELGRKLSTISSAARDTPQYPIASVDNALRLLLLFKTRTSVRVVDASRELGVARSTAHRILDMLAFYGVAEQDPHTRSYAPGPALREIGTAVVDKPDIRTLARPVIEQLRRDTDETVHLAILEMPVVRFVDCIESDRSVRVASRVGLTMPAHCTSVGKAMLASLGPDALRAYYPGQRLPAITENSITSRRELKRQLDEIRVRGYATNAAEGEDGFNSVAVAILDPYGQPVGAISVGAPRQRWRPGDFDDLGAMTLAAAGRVGALLR